MKNKRDYRILLAIVMFLTGYNVGDWLRNNPAPDDLFNCSFVRNADRTYRISARELARTTTFVTVRTGDRVLMFRRSSLDVCVNVLDSWE